jgi:hypothetical protein
MRYDRLAISMLRAVATGRGFAADVPTAVTAFVKTRPDVIAPDVQLILLAAAFPSRPYLPPFTSPVPDAFGCRVAIDDRTEGFRRHGELRISHLLTGEHARLPNPPKDIDGVIFSGDDLVVAFKKRQSFLYYSRIGDVHWREASCERAYTFSNLVFVKGTLYGLMCQKCRLAVVELHNNSAELSFLGDESTSVPFTGCQFAIRFGSQSAAVSCCSLSLCRTGH